jgi:hypothetical protein
MAFFKGNFVQKGIRSRGVQGGQERYNMMGNESIESDVVGRSRRSPTCETGRLDVQI